VVATAAYNLLEGIVATLAGLSARSISLIGFGFDSFIELAAATAVVWRMAGEMRGLTPAALERLDTRVHRLVGVTFFCLGAYVTVQSAWTLWTAQRPDESLVGIILAIVSLIVMPLVAWGKLTAARQIGSRALQLEAKETLACSYLSLVLLLGLGANAVAGWWWSDPVAALLMVPWLFKEGLEAFNEKGDD
jgi:divalent metal cation (Fe/Co/Zn/Cd) transporter